MKVSFDVHAVYQLMHDSHIQFSYKGPITQDVLISLGDTIKEELHRDDCDARVIRKVFSVLVEAAHNILKYSSEKSTLEKNKTVGIGLIGIGKAPEGCFVVFSGNFVTPGEATEIQRRLEFINSLSPAEITKNYQQQIRQGTISENGSAGLGLYEVARMSGRPIDFRFTPGPDGLVFFEMKIIVKVED